MRYTAATAATRHRLIHEQKYPKTYRAIWYETATAAIKRFISCGMEDESVLTTEIDRLGALEPTNEQEEQKYALNIDAIQSFLNSYDCIEFDGLSPSLANQRQPHLMMRGVAVSVSPDIYTSGQFRGREAAGAMKLYLSKGDPLSLETARHGAVVLYLHRRDALSGSTLVRPQFCSIFDVFAGQCHRAPTAHSQRIRNIEFSCAEIAALWPTI
jgi:hypothetical protein